jgi:hypothetical protein
MDLRSIVGAVAYAAGGMAVDLSAEYSSIKAAWITRVFTTGTKAASRRVAYISEGGTDLFTNGKLRIVPCLALQRHTHTVGLENNVVKATGALALRNATETGAAAVCGSALCTGTHPNTVVAQRTNILEAPGASKVAVATTVGNLAADVDLDLEAPNGTDLSTETFEFFIIGVRK